jgi:hypothetical protein
MQSRSALAIAGLVSLIPAVLQAQERVRFDISPRAGLYVPTGAIGPAARGAGPWYLRLDQADPSLTVELSAQARWPGARVQTRVSGLYALPSSVPGEFQCSPGQACPAVLLPVDAEVSVIAAVADVIVSPMAGERVQPYAALGAGVKRYGYSWDDAMVFMTAGAHSETSFTLHAGLGVEVGVGANHFRLEIGDFWNGRGPVVASGTNGTSMIALRRRAQHDIGVSLGYQLLRF